MLMMLAMRVAEIRKPFPADADDARHAIRRNSSNDGVELIANVLHSHGRKQGGSSSKPFPADADDARHAGC